MLDFLLAAFYLNCFTGIFMRFLLDLVLVFLLLLSGCSLQWP